jgi:hypothetical protein
MQAALEANGQQVQWHIARHRKTIEKMVNGWQKNLVRAWVEHPFHIARTSILEPVRYLFFPVNLPHIVH